MIKDKMPDTDLEIYYGNGTGFYGKIRDGSLHMISEVWGDDHDSEKHYEFIVEDTNKLFSIISVEGFIELCKKERVKGFEEFIEKNNLHPKIACI